LDGDYSLFDLFGCASDSERSGGVGDDQFEHKPGLEFSSAAGGMQCEL
jgi:hypothetical protein